MRSIYLWFFLTCLPTALLMAQAVDVGSAWQGWRDSVALLGPGELRTLLDGAESNTASSPDLILRRAFLKLRSGEIQHQRALLDGALADFCSVQASRSSWWLPWLGIGLAQALLAKDRFPVRPANCHTEGASYLQGAGISFARALEVAPSSTEAALALVDVVENDPTWGLGSVARQSLRRFGASGAPQPATVLLLRARLERNGGDRDSVLPLLGAYLANGGDSGIGLLESARERFFRGDGSAADDYWAGVRQAKSTPANSMLQTQLLLVARPGEMQGFAGLTGDSLVRWVRAFWTRREVEAGVPSGERLAEHYRRYEVAWRGFRPVSLGLGGTTVTATYRMSQSLLNAHTPTSGDSGNASQPSQGTAGEPVSASLLYGDESLLPGPETRSDGFDVRGQVYLRHGPPDDMAGPLWVYRRAGREYVIRINGSYPGTPCNLAAKYCRYEMAGRRPPPEVQHKWESEWRGMLADLERFDGQTRHFADVLPVTARLYAFPQTDDLNGGLVIAFAIPAERLPHSVTPEGQAYQIHLHLIVTPFSGDFRVDHDTTRTLVVQDPLSSGAFLQAIEPLPLDPGRYMARLIITGSDSTIGTILAVDSLELGDGSTDLVLSDLIFSRGTSGLAWRRGNNTVRMDPLGRVPRSETLQLYYELAGLTPGAEYLSKVELFRGAPWQSRPELTLSFRDDAERTTARVYRQFGLERLKPGNYVVQVTVVSDGRRVVRRSPMVVTD